MASARWSRRVLLAALASLALISIACTADDDRRLLGFTVDDLTVDGFYEVPQPLPAGDPGEVIRTKRLYGAPDGSIAHRVLYHSTDRLGNDIAVSGIAVVPTGDPPKGGWPVVSWGHPTTGIAAQCAPSLLIEPFVSIEGMRTLVQAGYIVVATDYSGMGAKGVSAYLVGQTEGRNVLDAARAVRKMDVGAGTDLLLWGHSQGGQAVLFAGQEAASYAPELHLLGVAAAAPATDLGSLLDSDIGDVSGVSLGSYAMAAYLDAYVSDTPGLELSQVLTPDAITALPSMADKCLFTQTKALHAIATPLVGKFLAADPVTTPPWSTILAENTPGGSPIEVPVLLAQGTADTLVKPTITESFFHGLCASGEHAQLVLIDKATHGTVANDAAPTVKGWFDTLVAGRSVPDECAEPIANS